MPLTRPPPAVLSQRSEPEYYSPSLHPTVTYTLTAGGLLTPRIKCTLDNNKKEYYTFQSKSDGHVRNMTVKDHKSNQVCKIRSKGDHLLDLHLTTDTKDINVQLRDMIAFKKAVEKNSQTYGNSGYRKIPSPYSSKLDDEDDYRPDRYLTGSNNVCWAFEYEGRIYQWTAGSGQGILAPPGSDVLLCHSTSLGPATKIAKLQSSHIGASDKMIISSGPIAQVMDKPGLQVLLLASVLSLMEIINERSRELIDFE